MPINTKGVALVYSVKRDFDIKRISLSIHALYLRNPSSFGGYDRYEGFAQVPGEISWRFPLYQAPNEMEFPIWTGQIDDITGTGLLERALVQVRLSNSKTNTLGPVVLEQHMSKCK